MIYLEYIVKNQESTAAANATANRSEGKGLVAIIIIIVLIIAGIAWAFANTESDAVSYPNTVPANTNTDISGTNSTSTTASSSVSSYTLADISSHKDASSCWVAVDGSVYDMTSFVGQHEGGDIAILSLCGKDGSADFHEQHGMGGREQQAVFAKYRIGTLTK